MKPKMTLCLAMILEVAAAAQGVRSDDATAAFRKMDPPVQWNVASAEIADVDCDGKPDTVMLGYTKDEVAVGIVFAAPGKKPQLFTFPIQAGATFGFCVKPERIKVSPLICESSNGTVLSGCKATEGCKAFSIANTGCDPFYFYWNSSIGTVSSWQQRK